MQSIYKISCRLFLLSSLKLIFTWLKVFY